MFVLLCVRLQYDARRTANKTAHEPAELADISYGDERIAAETGQSSIVLRSTTESATGQAREQLSSFIFDKVFEPKASQRDVFEEIEMLAQSVLDGYNVRCDANMNRALTACVGLYLCVRSDWIWKVVDDGGWFGQWGVNRD